MHRILTSTKLDFYMGKSSLKTAAGLLLLAAVLGALSNSPSYAILISMVFAVTSCGAISSIQEKNHSEKLYGILPLKKSEMIIGRYLYALIIGVGYIIFAAIMGFVLLRIRGGSLDAFSYWVTLAVGFVYFCFGVGIAYPIYLKFTFAKAYLFTMLPMYIIVILLLMISRRANLTSNLGRLIIFFKDHLYLLPVFGIIAGLILLTVSALIANLIYSKKEI